VLAVAIVRNVPVAPFTVVNIACGVVGLPLQVYLLGTLAGMFPGTVLLSAFGREIGALLVNPTWPTLAALVGVAALTIGFAFAADQYLANWGDRKDAAD
jgi:uncharacterized membrane protein YdjX (TVP38/TMEM64 family)